MFYKCNGEAFDVLESIYPLRGSDAKCITHFVHLVQDLRTQEELNSLTRLAFHDSLTGLPNRNLLNDRLERTLLAARRKHTMFALLYIDIDGFKQINDAFGHAAGDELLRRFAARLARALRRSDTVGRWGGDEFIALFEDIDDKQAAIRVGRELMRFCDAPYSLCGKPRRVTVSVGMSFYPRDGDSIQALLDVADRAMYAAKDAAKHGRLTATASQRT